MPIDFRASLDEYVEAAHNDAESDDTTEVEDELEPEEVETDEVEDTEDENAEVDEEGVDDAEDAEDEDGEGDDRTSFTDRDLSDLENLTPDDIEALYDQLNEDFDKSVQERVDAALAEAGDQVHDSFAENRQAHMSVANAFGDLLGVEKIETLGELQRVNNQVLERLATDQEFSAEVFVRLADSLGIDLDPIRQAVAGGNGAPQQGQSLFDPNAYEDPELASMAEQSNAALTAVQQQAHAAEQRALAAEERVAAFMNNFTEKQQQEAREASNAAAERAQAEAFDRVKKLPKYRSFGENEWSLANRLAKTFEGSKNPHLDAAEQVRSLKRSAQRSLANKKTQKRTEVATGGAKQAAVEQAPEINNVDDARKHVEALLAAGAAA